MSFGAIGDGYHDDTSSIRSAILALEKGGGGTLLFPDGHVFLSKPLNISSNTMLLVNGILRASNSSVMWPLIPPLPWYGGGVDSPLSGQPEWQPFILAMGDNITVTGGGLIDGSGSDWWLCAHGVNPLQGAPCSGFSRPRLLQPRHATNFKLFNVSLQDSPAWTIHLANVTNALLFNFTVTAPASVGNTDGVDVDCSSNVTILDFLYAGGDDAIAVKAGLDWLGREFGRATEDVLVRGLTVLSGNGFAVGSEMSASVRNVRFENVLVDCKNSICKHGLYVKTMRGRGGAVSEVTVLNATVRHVGFGHGLTLEYQRNIPVTNVSATPSVSNISIIGGVIEDAGVAFSFAGLPESQIMNLELSSIILGAGIGRVASDCSNTTGVCSSMPRAWCPPCLKNA